MRALLINLNRNGGSMARQLLQQCLQCGAWTLATTCPSCGGNAQAAAPLKWSPEDHRAEIRRKMYNVTDANWASSLASLPSLDEMKSVHDASEEE